MNERPRFSYIERLTRRRQAFLETCSKRLFIVKMRFQEAAGIFLSFNGLFSQNIAQAVDSQTDPNQTEAYAKRSYFYAGGQYVETTLVRSFVQYLHAQ